MSKLGILRKINLRDIWAHEERDFSTWLAREENINLLSDELGVEIDILQNEASVGKFNLDLLAEESNTGKKIIIENQIETTNHDHLGKIITYASGHDANYVVWIFKDIREEHRHAIDWLNEHSDDETFFFGVKIELWQIGNSDPAPKFQVICKPNNWGKIIKQQGGGELTKTKLLQLEYWQNFKEYGENQNVNLNFRTPRPQHWYDLSVGSSLCHIVWTVNTTKKLIATEIYISDDKELFHYLYEKKDQIEQTLGEEVLWMELDEKKASRIKIERRGDIYNRKNWEEQFEWLLEQGMKFERAFSPLIEEYAS
ncbi:MAG: Uncharacterized protein XD93_0116 [candidate division WS6 bacterium 34_10]|uniref:DUF4268 domain-containing protein n=1 Tax=candidate division WS6 bacterium 34_10 TaxID=1641389 RepID=A0A101HJR0_9BACT|nr:MAG: Uncharacterized protein XD93_0116 [candidate division WS6 bacterium 34_10]